MNAPDRGFRHAVGGVFPGAAHANLDDARIVLHQLSEDLAPHLPELGQFAYPVMPLKRRRVGVRHRGAHPSQPVRHEPHAGPLTLGAKGRTARAGGMQPTARTLWG